MGHAPRQTWVEGAPLMAAQLVRVRAATVYFIEARLELGRSWKQITSGIEWPPYKDKGKADRAAKKLNKEIMRKRF